MVTSDTSPHYDAVVIGAGIIGMYQVYSLNRLGLSVRGFEAGSDVGGTWYWNRYPGCRLDTESYAYGYFTLKGILPEWQWSERFAGQPELLRYARCAADRMGVRPHYQFDTRVLSALYGEAENLWRLKVENSADVTCRFLLSAVGPLSATRMPDISGVDSFEGQSFHSSRWSHGEDGGSSDVTFAGKRVGIIGTGATGVQIIPIVAKTADKLHIFQHTPNWCTPLGNHLLPDELLQRLRGDPDPNFFTLVGAHNGAAFCNIGVCGALQVEWVTEMIGRMSEQLCRADPEVSGRMD